MKRKTIKAIIKRKLEQWWESIEDETVRDAARKGTVVTGGCIASMLLNEPVNDYDVYFKDRGTAKLVADYYLKQFNAYKKTRTATPLDIYIDEAATDRIKIVVRSAGIVKAEKSAKDPEYQYFESAGINEAAGEYVAAEFHEGETDSAADAIAAEAERQEIPAYKAIFCSSNAITLSGKVQLIFRFYGQPEELHENYDFVHCTNFYTSYDDALVLRAEALEALLAKELVYVGSKYPICSVIRLRKFLKRGFTINAGQILKMCLQVSKLDLTDPKVLEEQLTGVDAAFFAKIIKKLKDRDPKVVDAAYLIEIIDRMF